MHNQGRQAKFEQAVTFFAKSTQKIHHPTPSVTAGVGIQILIKK